MWGFGLLPAAPAVVQSRFQSQARRLLRKTLDCRLQTLVTALIGIRVSGIGFGNVCVVVCRASGKEVATEPGSFFIRGGSLENLILCILKTLKPKTLNLKPTNPKPTFSSIKNDSILTNFYSSAPPPHTVAGISLLLGTTHQLLPKACWTRIFPGC